MYVAILTHKHDTIFKIKGVIDLIVGPFAEHDTAVEYCWANFEIDEDEQLKDYEVLVKPLELPLVQLRR